VDVGKIKVVCIEIDTQIIKMMATEKETGRGDEQGEEEV
jgi:hypothetical protein